MCNFIKDEKNTQLETVLNLEQWNCMLLLFKVFVKILNSFLEPRFFGCLSLKSLYPK